MTSNQETIDLNLDLLRQEYEAGTGEALFAAIDFCFSFGVDVPGWATHGFRNGWARYRGVVPDRPEKANKSTLGGAFCIERERGFTAVAARRRRLVTLVWQEVQRQRRLGRSVDEDLFEDVAEKITCSMGHLPGFYSRVYGTPLPEAEGKPVSAATVKTWYYGYKNELQSRISSNSEK